MPSMAGAFERIKVVHLDVDMEGETLRVEVDASRFTTADVLTLSNTTDRGERIRVLVSMLHSWDTPAVRGTR